MTLAGFWVDGAVRLPKHKDSDCGMFYVKSKEEFDELLDIVCMDGADVTADYYWLDTSSRDSLTPEELFSVLKLIFPGATGISKTEDGEWVTHNVECGIKIQWGDLTKYPVEEEWVQVTRDNVSQHLFKKCRFRNHREQMWLEGGDVAGWDPTEDCCVVSDGGALDPYRFVEVSSKAADS